ncbi:MAG: hypothetical protein JWM02_3515 [Frankiales bacterium]|nr:hypothetical protein [Frankiales bacterium]
MIVEPEDRQPGGDDNLVDACHAAGAGWNAGEIASARRLLVGAYGGDARAQGAANAALKALARRADSVRNLGGLLHKLERDGDLDTLRVSDPSSKRSNGSAEAQRKADSNASRLEQHTLGTAARRAAFAVLAPEYRTNTARVDREALQLIEDPEWLAEQAPLGQAQ